jgi:hypothetical protein
MPAVALAIALTCSSIAKSWLLGVLLGSRVAIWRASLVISGLAVAVGGMTITLLPQRFEWIELLFGIPAMLFLYCVIVWSFAFRASDRALFRKRKRGAALEPLVEKAGGA